MKRRINRKGEGERVKEREIIIWAREEYERSRKIGERFR